MFFFIQQLGRFSRTCNPSKWEADIWGWLEVRRSAMLHYTVNQRPHWACRQYGHSGGTRGWLGVERCQLCLQDTSRNAKRHRRVAGGHMVSLCVKCCRMVDNAPRWRLSLSWPIQSDHLLIADCDDTAGAGTLTWQDSIHSWKGGPGEVMSAENLFIIFIQQLYLEHGEIYL